MAYPILAPNTTWYKSTASRATIKKISIVSNYTPTGSVDETWNADVNNSGSIKCYRIGTEIIMSANGAKMITANADSSYMFSTPKPSSGTPLPRFTALTDVVGAELLDTSEVTTFQSAFSYCEALKTLNLDSWDVRKVKNFQSMFQLNYKIGELDFSKWRAKPTNMLAMFNMNKNPNESLTELDFSNSDLSDLTAINNFAVRCTALIRVTFPSGGFAKCSNMSSLFAYCSSLETVDLGGLIPTNASNLNSAFGGCTSLKTIYASKNWYTTGDSAKMFGNCSKLVGGNGTIWDGNHITAEYAIVDSGEHSPGYFTLPIEGTVQTDYRNLWEIVEAVRDYIDNYTICSLAEIVPVLRNYPMLAPQQTWYKSSTPIDTITTLNIVGGYSDTEAESWNADVGDTGTIKCYLSGTTLTISAPARSKIRLNSDSANVFSGMKALSTISGLEYMDASSVTSLEKAFHNDHSLINIDISEWNLQKVTNTDNMFDSCVSLISIYLGKYLRSIGTSIFMRCPSLETVIGLDKVSNIGDLAFYYTPKLTDTDFDVSKITNIGMSAFRMSSIEDGQDFSSVPLESVGKYATRLKRWSQNALNAIRNVVFPDSKLEVTVPNPDSQLNYSNVMWSKEGNTVAQAGCWGLALYHLWNVLHADNPRENWLDWWNDVADVDGDFASKNSYANNNDRLGDVVTRLGWKQDPLSVAIEDETLLSAILGDVGNGGHLPVAVINSASGVGQHALPVVGYDPTTRKLAVLDPQVEGCLDGCLMWVAYEDLFVSIEDDKDRLYRFTYL